LLEERTGTLWQWTFLEIGKIGDSGTNQSVLWVKKFVGANVVGARPTASTSQQRE